MKRVRITSDLRRYNANTSNKDVGDCVKRALSLAFGLDYNVVGSELNKLKRDYGYSSYNTIGNINKFLDARGIKFGIRIPSEDQLTVQEFSEVHSTGTWLCLTGGTELAARGHSNHILCIIDGDIYDSWDSRDNKVVQYANVTNAVTEFPTTSLEGVLPEVLDFYEEYCEFLNNKFDYGEISISRQDIPDSVFDELDWTDLMKTDGYVDKYTFRCYVFAKLNKDIPKYSDYWPGQSYGKSIFIKLNPKFDDEKNIEASKKRGKQRIYDFVYAIRKDCDDAKAAEELETSKYLSIGDRKFLMRLPAWCRPLVTYVQDNSEEVAKGWEMDKYELQMEPLPDDPYYDDRGSVYFRADTMKELKDNLEDYRTKFLRVDYDY